MSSYGSQSKGGHGFWPALAGLLVGAGGLYAYTVLKPDNRVQLDWGDLEDYAYFLEDEGEREPPIPFKAIPLEVRAFGEVKATPDIAVITATLTAEDKLESRAVDNVAKRVNAVQAAITTFDVDVSVTNSQTNREYDQLCFNENREAQRRHNQINSDYWFNKRLDDRGDTETKRREAKPRIAQKICKAKTIKARTVLALRVSPPEAAGDVLQALANAGADKTRLYGYDFSNYDELYQEAASKAVSKARTKAEMIARHSKAELGEIVGFYVGRPARTGRFGPQPTIINKSSARTKLSRRARGQGSKIAPPPPPPPRGYNSDEVVVSGIRRVIQDSVALKRDSTTIIDGLSADEIGDLPALSISEALETITSVGQAGRSDKTQRAVDQAGREEARLSSNNNALQMSLLSGPKAIRVSALLAYDYKTVIDGTIVPEEER